MFGQDRNQLRKFFATSWQKRRENIPMEPLENMVADIVAQHPEYHALLSAAEVTDRDYTPADGETNPFLHMGMHITLAEQLSTDRPAGIRQLHQQISNKHGNAHDAEHRMMECLGLILWEAQRANRMPDEQAYLECLRKLL